MYIILSCNKCFSYFFARQLTEIRIFKQQSDFFIHEITSIYYEHLVPIERRLEALNEGGFNTFRLSTLMQRRVKI
jgi:hypothetical protein